MMVRVLPRAGAVAGLLVTAMVTLTATPAAADAGWFESGDTLLRMDLQLLNDAEVIRLPVNQWPLPRAAVAYALEHGNPHFANSNTVQAALERVRARMGGATGEKAAFDAFATAG